MTILGPSDRRALKLYYHDFDVRPVARALKQDILCRNTRLVFMMQRNKTCGQAFKTRYFMQKHIGVHDGEGQDATSNKGKQLGKRWRP